MFSLSGLLLTHERNCVDRNERGGADIEFQVSHSFIDTSCWQDTYIVYSVFHRGIREREYRMGLSNPNPTRRTNYNHKCRPVGIRYNEL